MDWFLVTKPSMLVVDDEIAIRATLQRWFSLRGFEVDAARMVPRRCRFASSGATTW